MVKTRLMEEQNQNTEEKILRAAEAVFLKKGMDGARMQDIATEAGINKALLHYYFRSKEKLFNAIFTTTFQQFIPRMDAALQTSSRPEELFKKLADLYIELLSNKPYLPLFILAEINREPKQINELLIQRLNLDRIIPMIREKVRQELGDTVDPTQIIVSIISAILFPFIARPLLTPILFNTHPDEFDAFIRERKAFLPIYIDHLFQLNSKSSYPA
jgi:TetR/AcrR family transcriptional regulator